MNLKKIEVYESPTGELFRTLEEYKEASRDKIKELIHLNVYTSDATDYQCIDIIDLMELFGKYDRDDVIELLMEEA